MLTFLFTVSAVYLLSMTISFIYDGKVGEVSCEIMKISVIVLFTICICGLINISAPQTIDVYRNKTTLEIAYKDSVPMDSVVVFKE